MMTISKFKDILEKKANIPFSTIAYVFVDPPPPKKNKDSFSSFNAASIHCTSIHNTTTANATMYKWWSV